jgi:hypothetical protein
MAYLAGMPREKTYAGVYPKIFEDLQRTMLLYTGSIRQAHLMTASRLPVPGPAVPQLHITINSDGYPSFPENLMEICSIRTEHERLVKQYIAQHYSRWFISKSLCRHSFSTVELASGGVTSTVPYTFLAAGASALVPPEYLPTGIYVIPQPRNMNRGYLARFITHVLLRQSSVSANNAFRFSHWRTRTGELRPAAYRTTDSDNRLVGGTRAPVNQRTATRKAGPEQAETTPATTAKDTGRTTGQATGRPPPRPMAKRRQQITGEVTNAEVTGQLTQHVRGQARAKPNEQMTGQGADAEGAGPARERPTGQPTPRARTTTRVGETEVMITDPGAEQMQVITQAEMTRLSMHGHAAVVPINGPGAGLPQYLVATEAIEALRQQPTPQSSPQRDLTERPEPQIDPALLELNVPAGRTLRSGMAQPSKKGPVVSEPVRCQKAIVEPTRRSTRRK